ncbi:tetratricopeptide repeat protein [Actinoplanes sp. TBRC 11911]|uniref:tetratricopeptide repeat protein n=1 Tax=Actinoplanes sp. TBRC 11911 TaxID=2729386 RepID=UPI00145EA73F|nr:tetratricopeptide repeat protein [Actinoplanes sp. TBRC 11911]NMO53586.1 tetratricopeptide repeat protein [Actinoplanes sp. TBRC 11911]
MGGPSAPGGADGDGERRLGAHAAPYMDADGTLHNLRPIGRLELSGADPEPLRVGDSEFGGMWFSAEPESGKPASGAGGGEGAADEASAARESHGGGAGAAQDQHGQAAVNQRAAERGPTGGTARAPHHPEPNGNAAAAPAQSQPAAAQEHLVVDMDITGLLNGVAITGDPSITVRSSDGSPPVTRSGLDPAAVRAEVAERVAAVVSGGGTTEESDQTGTERPALSAADLEAIRWRLDGGTLREVVDDRDALRELGERLDGPLADEEDNIAKAGLLSVRAEVYRLLNELGMAAAASRLALAHAESAGDTQSMVIAQAELAHVLRLRGDHKEADRLFAKALGAAVPDALRSVVHENAGRSCFDQGRHMEALDHFARAVRLGKQDDTDLAERVGVCLEAVYIHVLRDGWGPYPRETADILGPAKAKA